MDPGSEEQRHREIFRRVHAAHGGCVHDEWLAGSCRDPEGRLVDRPIVWSRRNGPWRQVEVLFVGAAPGNAGGMGGGRMGAHGTRIPFGGDIAGGNLDVLLSGAGLDRNSIFIVAALNQLPARGGGEPKVAELRLPVGALPSSLHLLRETLLAAGPRMVACLGNLAIRSVVASAGDGLNAGAAAGTAPPPRLPGPATLESAGLVRGRAAPWAGPAAPGSGFADRWRKQWREQPLPALLWLLHPSAQNMSPYAAPGTAFHERMVETMAALRQAVARVLGRQPPTRRGDPPAEGVYALPEWRAAVGPRHSELDRLWRERGV
jgi:uracil-DNA glycosylase